MVPQLVISSHPSVEGWFIDVFKQARQHLLRTPPRLPHVPLELHLHELAVIEEPVLDIRIYRSSLAPLGHRFTHCHFACSDNLSIRYAS